MGSVSWNPRAWDWENWSSAEGWTEPMDDTERQAKQEEQNRQDDLKAKANTAAKEEENVRKRAEVLAALSTSGYQASGTNTARSFLTSL